VRYGCDGPSNRASDGRYNGLTPAAIDACVGARVGTMARTLVAVASVLRGLPGPTAFAPATLTFIDLFAGMGGFHRALTALGHECVFASEIDDELRRLYVKNFRYMAGKTFGDIGDATVQRRIPEHQILCAGFPCQPFSKSGDQRGLADHTHGTLFHEIVQIAKTHKPDCPGAAGGPA